MDNTQAEQDKINREEEIKEAAAHQRTLLDIQELAMTKAGRNFIKYLFDSLMVGETPDIGTREEFLREQLGHIRAGTSVFNIVSEANSQIAGTILGELQKEKYVQKSIEARRG